MISLILALIIRTNSPPLIVLGWFADAALQIWLWLS